MSSPPPINQIILARLLAKTAHGSKVHNIGSGLGWGGVYGLIWWLLGGLILMPVLLRMPAFAEDGG